MHKQIGVLHERIKGEESIPKPVRGRIGVSLGSIKGFVKSIREAVGKHLQTEVAAARQQEQAKAEEASRKIHEFYQSEIGQITSRLRTEHSSVVASKDEAIRFHQNELEAEKQGHERTRGQLEAANARVQQLETQEPELASLAAKQLRKEYGIQHVDNLRVPMAGRHVSAESHEDVWAAVHSLRRAGRKTGFLDVFKLPNGQDAQVLKALAHNAGRTPIFKIGGVLFHADELTPAVAGKVRGLLVGELKKGTKLDEATVYDRDIHPDEVAIKPAYKRWGTWLAAGAAVAATLGGMSLFKNSVQKTQAPKSKPEVIRSIQDIKDSELFMEAKKAITPVRPDAGVDDVAITATLMRHELENLQQKIKADPSQTRFVDLKQLALDIHGRMARVRQEAVEAGGIEYKGVEGKSGPQATTSETLRKVIYPGMGLPREKWNAAEATYQRHMRPTWKVFKGFGRGQR